MHATNNQALGTLTGQDERGLRHEHITASTAVIRRRWTSGRSTYRTADT